MKLYITLSRERIAWGILALLLTVCICGKFSAAANVSQDAATNDDRVSFAHSVGCKVDQTPVNIKKVHIPDEFSGVYENYNLMQQQAGYNLKGYKGCEAVLYSYKVIEGGIADDDSYINLLVYRGRIIGGDISSVSLDGKMLPLKRI